MKNYLVRRNGDFNLFDDVFEDFFTPVFTRERSAMKTDIKETEKGYMLDVEMAGFKKEDISVSFENGYLTISAKSEEKGEEEKYLRRERTLSCERKYYLGEIDEGGIKAKYENGVLNLTLPKKEEKKPETKFIAID